jgi:hypothetical protein
MPMPHALQEQSAFVSDDQPMVLGDLYQFEEDA